MSSKLDMLGMEWCNEAERSAVGIVPLKERGLVNEVDSNRETLGKRGVACVVVVEGAEDGPEEARITKLPHGVCKQKSLFKTSLPCVMNFSYTEVK
jgi:hypothetical protein